MSQSTKVTIPIEGMSCQHCVNSVIEALSKLAGVKEVKVDLQSGHAEVSGDNLHIDTLRAAIDDLGFTAGTPK